MRFSNVYGRYDNDLERMERVIPLFIRKINRDEPIIVYGEEKCLTSRTSMIVWPVCVRVSICWLSGGTRITQSIWLTDRATAWSTWHTYR